MNMTSTHSRIETRPQAAAPAGVVSSNISSISTAPLGIDIAPTDANTTVIPGSIPPQLSGRAAGLPPVLQLKDLPGHMGMRQLIDLGIVRPLDEDHAYHVSYGLSVEGRVAVTQRAIPAHVAVCALTACWVWIGGDMPNSIDVISNSHFRSTIFGRKIRVFNRQAPEGQCIVVNGLSVTSPVRTACDVATLPDSEWQSGDCAAMVRILMDEYDVSAAECLDMLSVNRFWPNTPRAKQFFSRLPFDDVP